MGILKELGTATLGGEFQEFRWVLDEIKDALANIHRQQTIQVAPQKEQLKLQREQLTKTTLRGC